MIPPTHTSVLLEESLSLLAPRPGGIYCDATLGLGGHAEAILNASSPDGRLVGIDRDRHALARAAERLAPFGDRVSLHHGCYADVADILADEGTPSGDGLDGLLLDLGVSSLQLDDPERGFAFRTAAPLDMRMDDTQGPTATEFLQELSEPELTRVLREYGEQPKARAVARAIKRYVDEAGVPDTAGLARVVAAVLPPRRRKSKTRTKTIHPATQAFMAIRIALNDELGQLQQFLERFIDVLAPEARVAVITFHSLEDRLVKRRFAALSRPGGDLPPGLPLTEAQRGLAPFERLTRRPVEPSAAEVEGNARARSARLRGVRYRGPQAISGEAR